MLQEPMGRDQPGRLWPFTFYFLLFAAVASSLPFFVLYYQELDFTGAQIGLLTGLAPLVFFFSAPLWTSFADARQKHRVMMSLAVLLSSVALIAYPLARTFLPVLLVAFLFSFFAAPITPFVDSSTMFMLGDKKDLYSRIRMGGTIGYGIAAPVAGMIVQKQELRYAFWLSAILMFLGFIVSQKLVYGGSESDIQSKGRVRKLLTNPRWILFLTVAFSGGLALAVFNNYLFPYMKELGASESTMGLALTIGTLSEVPALYFGNRLIERFKSYGLLMLSMAATILRLFLFAVSVSPGMVLVVQLLNGLTFPVMWVAGVAYADEHASPGMSATAQGLFSAMVMGFGTAVGGFIGGLLLDGLGGRGLYLVFGTAILIIVIVVAAVQRRMPAEEMPSTAGATG